MKRTSPRGLKIAVNGQLLPNRGVGGTAAVLVGLITALGKLADGDEEYTVIGPWQEPDWLRPYLGPNQRIIPGPCPPAAVKPSRPFPTWMPRRVRRLVAALMGQAATPPQAMPPPQFLASLGCDVVHFPYQAFTPCALPTVYNPHDLQHLHFPEFFSPEQIAQREKVYRAGCSAADTVVVGSQWVKEDIIRHYGLRPEKLQVIPWAAPTSAYPVPSDAQLVAVKAKYALRQPFAFYPAMIWEHKNHARLLEAVAYLREQGGPAVNLVCTGNRDHANWAKIHAHISALRLGDHVQFLGMVPGEEMRALYRLAHAVVVPTLFEAASGPVFEAWQDDVPVACSTVTSLPEQVRNAGILFDPYSVDAIAQALRALFTDPDLRRGLVDRGRKRLQDFSWERTAKAYRAVYRQSAQRPLTDEDRSLLGWDWMHAERAQLG